VTEGRAGKVTPRDGATLNACLQLLGYEVANR